MNRENTFASVVCRHFTDTARSRALSAACFVFRGDREVLWSNLRDASTPEQVTQIFNAWCDQVHRDKAQAAAATPIVDSTPAPNPTSKP